MMTRSIVAELEHRDIAADPLLRRCGLSRSRVDDPDAWLPLRAHLELHRLAREASGDPLFALAVARRAPLQVRRMAGYCAASSRTIREGLEAFSRFSSLLAEGFPPLTLLSTPTHDLLTGRLPALIQGTGAELAGLMAFVEFCRHASGERVRPTEVHLTIPRPAPELVRRLEAAFGASVVFNAPDGEIRFPRGSLACPLVHSDPALRDLLKREAERQLAMRSAATTEARVRAAILALGADRSASLEAVATRMDTSGRSLQRALAREGHVFRTLRDEALRDEALPLLADRNLTVAEAALRLGFTSRSAFHRAVVRWTGKPPRSGRARPAPHDR